MTYIYLLYAAKWILSPVGNILVYNDLTMIGSQRISPVSVVSIKTCGRGFHADAVHENSQSLSNGSVILLMETRNECCNYICVRHDTADIRKWITIAHARLYNGPLLEAKQGHVALTSTYCFRLIYYGQAKVLCIDIVAFNHMKRPLRQMMYRKEQGPHYLCL